MPKAEPCGVYRKNRSRLLRPRPVRTLTWCSHLYRGCFQTVLLFHSVNHDPVADLYFFQVDFFARSAEGGSVVNGNFSQLPSRRPHGNRISIYRSNRPHNMLLIAVRENVRENSRVATTKHNLPVMLSPMDGGGAPVGLAQYPLETPLLLFLLGAPRAIWG